MNLLINTLRLLWRIWFYVWMLFVILLLFPFLLIFTFSEKTYRQFFYVGKIWGTLMLFGMGFIPKIHGEKFFKKNQSYMLTSNHTSMMDIMMMFYLVKTPFVFVGKKELAKMPLFGYFYKRTCILVDRGNVRSRRAVFDECQRRINQGNSICIFPEGGVPDDVNIVLDTFKDGAFRLAIEHQIPIIPISFPTNKEKFSYHFFSGSPGVLEAYIHPAVSTEGMSLANKQELKEKVRQVILSKLKK